MFVYDGLRFERTLCENTFAPPSLRHAHPQLPAVHASTVEPGDAAPGSAATATRTRTRTRTLAQVKVFKNKAGATEVWVQSELRIGQSDLDVNYKRMEALLGHLGANLK